MIYMAALRECERAVIVSGEHGIIQPDEWVKPYEHLILDDSEKQQSRWAKRCASQLAGESDICSYLSQGYADILTPYVDFEQMTEGDMFQVAKQLGKTADGKKLKEKPWPSAAVLEYVYHNSPTVRDLRTYLLHSTKLQFFHIDREIQRALDCPLHRLSGALLISKAHEQECL